MENSRWLDAFKNWWNSFVTKIPSEPCVGAPNSLCNRIMYTSLITQAGIKCTKPFEIAGKPHIGDKIHANARSIFKHLSRQHSVYCTCTIWPCFLLVPNRFLLNKCVFYISQRFFRLVHDAFHLLLWIEQTDDEGQREKKENTVSSKEGRKMRKNSYPWKTCK